MAVDASAQAMFEKSFLKGRGFELKRALDAFLKLVREKERNFKRREKDIRRLDDLVKQLKKFDFMLVAGDTGSMTRKIYQIMRAYQPVFGRIHFCGAGRTISSLSFYILTFAICTKHRKERKHDQQSNRYGPRSSRGRKRFVFKNQARAKI
jgi:hypothetical protein